MAAMVIASPPVTTLATEMPRGAVLRVITVGDASASLTPKSMRAGEESRPAAFLRGLVDQLAVVRPHRSVPDQPPTLQMFLVVAPVKGQVCVHAIGSF